MSESQCDVAHGCETSLWHETYLIVAVVVRVPAAFADGRINPPIGGKMTVEDVVKVRSDYHFFESDKLLGYVERVAEVDIGLGVAGQ